MEEVEVLFIGPTEMACSAPRVKVIHLKRWRSSRAQNQPTAALRASSLRAACCLTPKILNNLKDLCSMMTVNQHCVVVLLFALLVSQDVAGFTPIGISAVPRIAKSRSIAQEYVDVRHQARSSTALSMSSEDDGGGGLGGILPLIGAIFIGGLFLGSSFLPMMGGGGGGVAPLANSVATSDGKQQTVVANDKFRLSRAAIQEKLSVVPVFYVVGSNGDMETNLFLSYDEAKGAAGSKVVKATTLDQVE